MKKRLIHFSFIFVMASLLVGCQHPNLLRRVKVYDDTSEMIEATKKVVKEISIEDFKQLYERDMPVIIDIRSENERESGYIPGSVHINRGVLEFWMDDEETWEDYGKEVPLKSDLIILYCGSGGRSALATKSLMQLGYENVQSLEGGWSDWNETYPDIIEH